MITSRSKPQQWAQCECPFRTSVPQGINHYTYLGHLSSDRLMGMPHPSFWQPRTPPEPAKIQTTTLILLRYSTHSDRACFAGAWSSKFSWLQFMIFFSLAVNLQTLTVTNSIYRLGASSRNRSLWARPAAIRDGADLFYAFFCQWNVHSAKKKFLNAMEEEELSNHEHLLWNSKLTLCFDTYRASPSSYPSVS
jgi:hypothetical protein